MNEINGGNVRNKMIHFIKTHYANVLGEDLKYLDVPGGLDVLHQKYCKRS